jgi:hypothetical protein
MVSMLQIQAVIDTLVNPQSTREMRQICRLWNSLKTSLCDDLPPKHCRFFAVRFDPKEFTHEKVRHDF